MRMCIDFSKTTEAYIHKKDIQGGIKMNTTLNNEVKDFPNPFQEEDNKNLSTSSKEGCLDLLDKYKKKSKRKVDKMKKKIKEAKELGFDVSKTMKRKLKKRKQAYKSLCRRLEIIENTLFIHEADINYLKTTVKRLGARYIDDMVRDLAETTDRKQIKSIIQHYLAEEKDHGI